MFAAIKRVFLGPQLRTYDMARDDLGGVPWRAAMPTSSWFVDPLATGDPLTQGSSPIAAWLDSVTLPEPLAARLVPAPSAAAPRRLPPLPVRAPELFVPIESAELLILTQEELVAEPALPSEGAVPILTGSTSSAKWWAGSAAVALVVGVVCIGAAAGRPTTALTPPERLVAHAPKAAAVRKRHVLDRIFKSKKAKTPWRRARRVAGERAQVG